MARTALCSVAHALRPIVPHPHSSPPRAHIARLPDQPRRPAQLGTEALRLSAPDNAPLTRRHLALHLAPEPRWPAIVLARSIPRAARPEQPEPLWYMRQ